MVDRITPQTTDADRAWLRDTVGIDDGWPVVAEPFRQWVVEDRFAAGRPRFEDVGVLLADNVHDWEIYKLRMLNATHSCMAYLMALHGVVYVDEAIGDPGGAALSRALPRDRGDPDACRDSRPSGCRVRPHGARPLREHRRSRSDRAPVHRRHGEVSDVPDSDDRAVRSSSAARSSAPHSRWPAGRATSATVPAAERAPDASGDRSATFAARALEDPLAFLELTEVFTPPAARKRSVSRRLRARGGQPRRARPARRDRTGAGAD